jgi:hypothetical protein
MKHQVIRKRLLVETLVITGICVVAITGVYFLSMLHEDFQQQNISLQTQVTSLNNEMTSLNDKYVKIRANHDVYEEAKAKSATDQLSINRELVRRLFINYNTKYFLKNPVLQVGPIMEVADPPYKRNNSTMIYSEINISVDALTDEDIYRLIQSIENDFTGAVKMTRLVVTRQSRLNAEVAKNIIERGDVKMVTATMRFLWLGIRSAEAQQQANANDTAR